MSIIAHSIWYAIISHRECPLERHAAIEEPHVSRRKGKGLVVGHDDPVPAPHALACAFNRNGVSFDAVALDPASHPARDRAAVIPPCSARLSQPDLDYRVH